MKCAPIPTARYCLLTLSALKAVSDVSPMMTGGKASMERATQWAARCLLCGLGALWL